MFEIPAEGLSRAKPTNWRGEGKVERRKEEAVALVMGDIHSAPPLVRIHSQCLTGDVFASMRCDCRQQLELSLSLIADAGAGILIYEQQEGRGIGLMAKIPSLRVAGQRPGHDRGQREARLRRRLSPVHAARRNAEAIGCASEVRLISNNPDKVAALENAGIKVVERVSAEVEPYEHAEKYLQTKKETAWATCSRVW